MATVKPLISYPDGVEEIRSGDTLSGGGGLTNFDEAAFAASPNNTVNVAQLKPDAALSANADIVIQPKGTGAILGQVPDNTATGGNKRGQNAVDFQQKRGGNDQVASGLYAVIGGGYGNKSSNTCTVIGGGESNEATGDHSTAVGGYKTKAQGNYSSVGGGTTNTAGGSQSTIGGGGFNQATANYSLVGGGYYNIANANHASILGGQLNTANGKYSTQIIGHYGKGIDHGDIIIAPDTGNTTQGLYQHRIVGLRRNTSDATPLPLSTVNSTTYILVPSYYAATFKIQVIGRSNAAGNEMASFVVDGSVFRQSAASTTTVTSTVTVISRTTGTMDCTVTADTASGGVIITVTGVAGKTINWYAYADLTEINGSS